ncbi:14141_t:CDS:1, partial [Racocetra fulgida]
EHKLRQKGQGRCIHVSEFLCEPLGRVHLTEEQHAAHPEISK